LRDLPIPRADRPLRTDWLLAEHGPAMPLPELRQIIAADCPRMIAGRVHDVCGAHFSGLIGLNLGRSSAYYRH